MLEKLLIYNMYIPVTHYKHAIRETQTCCPYVDHA